MNPATHDPPAEPGRRPRLGELLVNSGLLSQQQLDESLAIHHSTGQSLGHVLVENGIVPAHSIAMALADQHGGPLKTEYGFATGRGNVQLAPAPSAPTANAPLLRLAPLEGAAAPEAAVAPAVAVAPEAAVEQPINADESGELAAEERARELATRVEELQGEVATVHAQLGAALTAQESLATQLAAERTLLEETAGAADRLSAELAEANANNDLRRGASAESDAKLAATLDQLAAERAANEQAVKAAETLRSELAARVEEVETKLEVSGSKNEQALAVSREQLEAALAAHESLASQLAAERTLREEAVVATDVLRAELAEANANNDLRRGATGDGEAKLTAALDQLAAERATNEQAAKTAQLLQSELDAKVGASAVLESEIAELRAVIELQEQTLATAAARERTEAQTEETDGLVYSAEGHLLFAPGAGQYELFERSGPPPAGGTLVELSGGRMCRVVRLGPSPFPGAANACAYLELV